MENKEAPHPHGTEPNFKRNLSKDRKITDLNKVYSALFEKPRTMKEVYIKTGILREFVCWYCKDLRESGRLYNVGKRKCTITGQIVNEYTTNEIFVTVSTKQLSLF